MHQRTHLGHEPTQIHMNPGEPRDTVPTALLLKNHRSSSSPGDLPLRHDIECICPYAHAPDVPAGLLDELWRDDGPGPPQSCLGDL
ncbi:unnamed protein product [Leuciscus chuanchicus]